MDIFLRAAAFVLLFCIPAYAEPNEQDGGVGRVLVCDSSTQLERFVAFRNEGQDTDAAVQSVNDEAHNPIACGVVVAAFSYGKTVGRLKMKGESVSIVEITIV